MKNNIYIKYLLLAVLSVSVVGCSESFLDKTPTDDIAVSDLQKTAEINPGILESTLTGVYTMMYDSGTGGLGSHEDFGQKAVDIFGGFLTSDIALTKNTYSRYRVLAELQNTVDYTDTRGNYQVWRYYYRLIRSTNLIISALGGNDAEITDANRYSMGQVKALRAYAYFYLTQYYIPEYSETSEILPIYIDSNDPENKPQSTTKEVYDLMIDDLETAISLLETYTRTEKYEMNKDIAKSLLAYVYASTGTSENNLKAKQLAEEVIPNYPLTTMAEATGGFNDVNTPSWMWGVDITIEAGLHLWSFWGQMDRYSYSYQHFGDIKAMDANLYSAIKPNDIRKTQFSSIEDDYLYAPLNKFYHPNKIPNGAGTYTELDYVYMRVDEMYLLSAEMSAKEGFDQDAKNRLKDLLAVRYENAEDYAYVDALSSSELQDEIYLQTRIEFWGEGKTYLAMKRNKVTTNRADNHAFLKGISVPYNDDRLTFEIPQSEIQNNPFINR